MSEPMQDLAEIAAAVGRGDRPQALSLAGAALARGVDHPLVMLLAAEGLEEAGRGAQALALLQQATVAAPEEVEVWRRFGGLLARQDRLAEAVAALETALDLDPDCYPVLVDAGAASFRSSDLMAADGYYRRAHDLAPAEAEPLAAIAAIAARREDAPTARAFAERAIALRPDALSAHLALGRADLLDVAADRTEARMTSLLGRSDLPEETRIAALDLRAEARDLADRPTEAFADYQARNVLLERLNAPRIARELTERRAHQARRLAVWFAAAPPEPWRTPAGRDTEGAETVRGHAFLLGFPRSGTTLLEKVLASHPAGVTLEEVDRLAEAGGHLLADAAGLRRLAEMSPQEAQACRRTYWRGVRETLGDDLAGKVLVDKMPLHTQALPLIAKLFPDAKILFALRDPRDVVLSCFRRRFRINAAMFEFLTLEGTAGYYDQVMTLAATCRALLPLDVREVRHEAMVADFEAEVRQVLAFLGLDWDPAVRGFADRARARLRTPSDPQVARGLNADGVGQWRRYARELEPVREVLAPWVTRFGYPADGG